MITESDTETGTEHTEGRSGTTRPESGGRMDGGGHDAQGGKYWRSAAMIATSMATMFALTYANTYRLADVKWSETRFFMTFVMGAAMTVIMLGFMMGMYRHRTTTATDGAERPVPEFTPKDYDG